MNTATITVVTDPCLFCGTQASYELDMDKVQRWITGEHIQFVFPELSVADRERLISGTCSECFDKVFGEEE